MRKQENIMRRPYRPIPEWYTNDWSPARGRGELPQMTWSDIEAIIPRLLVTSKRQDHARSLIREIWLLSTGLEPMALLQQLLWVGARAFDPGPPAREPTRVIPTPASGPLPRWSYTDIEVALSYTWKDQALMIANQRHHDMLAFRGEDVSGVDTARLLFLLVSGLPSAPVREERMKTPAAPDFSAAA